MGIWTIQEYFKSKLEITLLQLKAALRPVFHSPKTSLHPNGLEYIPLLDDLLILNYCLTTQVAGRL
jgi:hypothetical protein